MLQQQRATIEVHLSVGDPGLPQVITASLRVGVREGERKYTQIQARTHTLHTHVAHTRCTHTPCVLHSLSLAGKWKEQPPVWHNDFAGKQ